jgi:hypothetical protein
MLGTETKSIRPLSRAWHARNLAVSWPEVDCAAKAFIHDDFDFPSKNRFLTGTKVEYPADARFRLGEAG